MLPPGTHPKTIDLTGNKYGHLTVTKYIGRKNHRTIWQCQCTCGNTHNYQASNLNSGATTRCIKCRYKNPNRTPYKHEIKITYKGKTRTLKQWATITNIPHRRLYHRYRRGCKPARILTPGKLPQPNTPKITHKGKTRTLTQWAKHLGISNNALKARLTNPNWTRTQALTKPNTWNNPR